MKQSLPVKDNIEEVTHIQVLHYCMSFRVLCALSGGNGVAGADPLIWRFFIAADRSWERSENVSLHM